MIVAFLAILWVAIIIFLSIYLGTTPKGKRWLKILARSKRVWRLVAIVVGFVGAIILTYMALPSPESEQVHDRKVFVDYSRDMVRKLLDHGALTVDSGCALKEPFPELAYVLPSILGVYDRVVQKGSRPRLVQLEDTLRMSFDGFKQFKNRGILITRGVQKKLGPRYPVRIVSKGSSHELVVAYRGDLWDNEQLCGLPATEAAIREHVDPALLMSVIRHVSDFDFDYVGENRGRGLMSLDSGENLEQLFMAARMLRVADSLHDNREDAIASLYPGKEVIGAGAEWRLSPLKKSWVKQVLNDVEFYRNNGLAEGNF